MDLARAPAQTEKPLVYGEGECFPPKLLTAIVIPKDEFTFFAMGLIMLTLVNLAATNLV